MAALHARRNPKRQSPLLAALVITPLVATGPLSHWRTLHACQVDADNRERTLDPERPIGGLNAQPREPKRNKSLSSQFEERGHKQKVIREKQRLAMGWVRYKGTVLSPDDFRRRARSLTGGQFAGMSDDLVGEAVHIVGTLEQKSRDHWTIMTADREGRSEGKVVIDATKLHDSLYRAGRSIRIWGIAQNEAIIEAWFGELLPPGVEWNYRLRDPGSIIGGKSQSFTVDCEAHNTGTQPLRRAVVTVRLYIPNSATQKTKTVTIKDLAVGETRRIPVELRLSMRTARIPKVEAAIVEYEF